MTARPFVSSSAVVDDDVQLAADLLGPAPEDREVALVARDGLDALELALRARFLDARGVVFRLPELGVGQELAPYLHRGPRAVVHVATEADL